jgi:hypothetical protein
MLVPKYSLFQILFGFFTWWSFKMDCQFIKLICPLSRPKIWDLHRISFRNILLVHQQLSGKKEDSTIVFLFVPFSRKREI